MFCSNCGNDPSAAVPNITSDVKIPADTATYELEKLDDVISYFSLKKAQYEEYDEVSRNICDWNDVCKVPALIWGGLVSLVSTVFIIVGLFFFETAAMLAGALFLNFLGAPLIAMFFLLNMRRRYKLGVAVDRRQELIAELAEHYNAYEQCPIIPEYTNPSILNAVRKKLVSGKADTLKKAFEISIEKSNRYNMLSLNLAQLISTDTDVFAVPKAATTETIFYYGDVLR